MRALRVLLTTISLVVLLTYALSAAAIEWILRDIPRPAPPRSAPTFSHRGLACLSVPSRQGPWWLRALFDKPDAPPSPVTTPSLRERGC